MSAPEKIDKLIDMVSKTNDFLSSADPHTMEATELKKEWFNYVLLSLEKANGAIDKIEADQHNTEKDLLQGLMQIREDLRAEMTTLRSSYDASLDKLEGRIEKTVESLGKKVDSISIPAIKQELKLEISKLRNELSQIINKTKESLRLNDIDPLKTNVNTLMVKVGGIGVVGGLIGSGLLMLAIAIIKHWLAGTP
jgi:hypothetical protein